MNVEQRDEWDVREEFENGAFWWITGQWTGLEQVLSRDPRGRFARGVFEDSPSKFVSMRPTWLRARGLSWRR